MSNRIETTDSRYPKRLLTLGEDRPKALYVEGHLPLDGIPTVAIIGARMCSAYGRYMAREYGMMLARKGIVLISGLSLGIDSVAINGALHESGAVYGVMGCGANVCYPPEMSEAYWKIREHYGILSEYADDEPPKAAHFRRRNRLMAALADTIIVIEARKKSAILDTVEEAVSLGKKVYALPGRATDRLSDGTNHLIKNGLADLTLAPEDVIEKITGQIAA